MCKDAAKFQNGRQRSTPIFLWVQKTQILLSHSPRYGDVQVIFSKLYLLKFKMAATNHFQFFVGAKTHKTSQKLSKFNNFIPHNMEMCK